MQLDANKGTIVPTRVRWRRWYIEPSTPCCIAVAVRRGDWQAARYIVRGRFVLETIPLALVPFVQSVQAMGSQPLHGEFPALVHFISVCIIPVRTI